MKHLYKSFDIKSDSGGVSGYFSTYDRIPDSYGDIVKAGAFSDFIKSMKESGHPLPLCYGHDLNQIVGSVDEIEDTETGPLMKATFFNSPSAQEKREWVKSGVVHQFSFAYSIKEDGMVELEDGTSAHELRKLDVHEVSITPIPANPRAEVLDVKAAAEQLAKAGRRNSAKDADAIREAITLLQGVLGELEEAGDGEDKGKANAAAKEPEQSNPRKDNLLEYIAKINMED